VGVNRKLKPDVYSAKASTMPVGRMRNFKRILLQSRLSADGSMLPRRRNTRHRGC
jgi:hypothetical protein